MRLIALTIVLALCAFAQRPAAAPSPTPAQKVDPKLHAHVLELIDAFGYRQMLQANLKSFIEEGKAEVMKRCEECDPAFGEEWAKRMMARANVEDYVKVVASAFEKSFTDEEIVALTAFHKAKSTASPIPLAPELRQKLMARMPSIQSEIGAGSNQIGERLSGEIGTEIQKEHPEYLKRQAPEKKN